MVDTTYRFQTFLLAVITVIIGRVSAVHFPSIEGQYDSVCHTAVE